MTKPRNADEANHGSDAVRKPKRVVEDYNAEFVGYINVNLTDGQKAAFNQWVDGGGFLECLDAWLADGIQFSVKLDSKSGGFMASATQRRAGSPNAGLCTTARAREGVTALQRVVFIVAYLNAGGNWQETQPLANPDRW